jgi:hypothetical protein
MHTLVNPKGIQTDGNQTFGTPGPIEDQMNAIRRELGPDYGQRLSYVGLPDAGKAYPPFNQMALSNLSKIYPIYPPGGMYIASPIPK